MPHWRMTKGARALASIEVALLLVVGSCTSGDSSDLAETSSEDSSEGLVGGTVTLSFSVSNGVRMGPTLVDPLVGSVYGDIYHATDVTLLGPADGAVAVVSLAVDDVDLTTLDVAVSTWTSEQLPEGSYMFLGMFDVDGNFEDTDQRPDPGDPVTLPLEAFDIEVGENTAVLIVFELVYG
jgi:hypothetical protein